MICVCSHFPFVWQIYIEQISPSPKWKGKNTNIWTSFANFLIRLDDWVGFENRLGWRQDLDLESLMRVAPYHWYDIKAIWFPRGEEKMKAEAWCLAGGWCASQGCKTARLRDTRRLRRRDRALRRRQHVHCTTTKDSCLKMLSQHVGSMTSVRIEFVEGFFYKNSYFCALFISQEANNTNADYIIECDVYWQNIILWRYKSFVHIFILFLFKGICVHGEAQRQFGQKEKYEINFKAHNVNGERNYSILYMYMMPWTQ